MEESGRGGWEEEGVCACVAGEREIAREGHRESKASKKRERECERERQCERVTSGSGKATRTVSDGKERRERRQDILSTILFRAHLSHYRRGAPPPPGGS